MQKGINIYIDCIVLMPRFTLRSYSNITVLFYAFGAWRLQSP